MAKKGKRPKPSQGGRTASEAGLAASMAAAGKKVSRTNLNVARGYGVPSGVTQVTSGSGYTTRGGIVSKRKPRVTKKGARVADRVFGTPNLTGRLTVAAKQAENRAKRAAQGKPVRQPDKPKQPRKRAPQNRVAASNRQVGRLEQKISSVRRGTDSDPFLLSPSRLSKMPTSTRPKKQELKRLNRRLDRAKDKRADRVAARRVNRTLKQVRSQYIKQSDPAERKSIMRDWKNRTKTQRQRNEMLASFYAVDDKVRAEQASDYRTVAKTTRDKQGNKIGAKQVKQLNTRYRQGNSKEDVDYNLRLMRKDVLSGKARRAILPTEKAARQEQKRIEEETPSLGATIAGFFTEGIPEVAGDAAKMAEFVVGAQSPSDLVGRIGSAGQFSPVASSAETLLDDESVNELPKYEATMQDYGNVALSALLFTRLGKGGIGAAGNVVKLYKNFRNAGRARVFTVGPKGAATTKAKYFGPKTVSKERALQGALFGGKGTQGALAQTKTVQRGSKALETARLVGDSKAYRLTRKGVGITLLGGAIYKHDWSIPAAVGTAEAIIEDPVQVLETTARGLIAGVTSPVVILANIGMAARTGNTKPLEYMADAFYKEGEALFHVYTSGDADIVKEATIDDYGLINLMGAGWLTRPLWRGMPGKVSRKIAEQVPSGLADGRNLAERWDRWTADMRAAAETTIMMDRERARAEKGMQDDYSVVYNALRKVNNGRAGRALKAVMLAAFEREVKINKDKLAEVLKDDIDASGDTVVSAREQLQPNANMSDAQLEAQARKNTRPALTIGDLAVFLQSRDAPMSISKRWIERQLEDANGTPEAIELRALLMAKELWEDGESADLFRQVRAELKSVDMRIMAQRDEILGTPTGSRAADQETAVAMERDGMKSTFFMPEGRTVVTPGRREDGAMAFVGGVNPYRVDAQGRDRLERPEVMAKDKVEADLARATALGSEVKASRADLRKVGRRVTRLTDKLGMLREADRKKRRDTQETAEESASRREREGRIAAISREIEEIGDEIGRGGNLDQINKRLNELTKQVERDQRNYERGIAVMRRNNPEAAELAEGQVWTGTGVGKLESDAGYQIVREDLLDSVDGSNKKHWWAVAPDGTPIQWRRNRELAKEIAADHRAYTPGEGDGATSITGTFQRDTGSPELDSEMRRPQIQEEYALFLSDMMRRLKASFGVGGKRGRVLEHRMQEGFWLGGSEPSYVSLLSIANPTAVRAVAAAIGKYFEQEAMIVFSKTKGPGLMPTRSLELTLKDNLTKEQVDAAIKAIGDEVGGSRLGNKAYFYLAPDDNLDDYTRAFSDLTEGEAKVTEGFVEFLERTDYDEAISQIPEIQQAANSYGERWGGRTYAEGGRTRFSEKSEGILPAREGGTAGRRPRPEDEVGFYPALINRLGKERELLDQAREKARGKKEGLVGERRAILKDLRNRKRKRRAKLRKYKPDYRIARKRTELDEALTERENLESRVQEMAAERQQLIDQVRGRLTKEELEAEVAAVLAESGIDEARLQALSPEEATRRTAELTAERDQLVASRREDEIRREELFDRADEADAEELALLDERINDAFVREAVISMLINDRRFLTLSATKGDLIQATAQRMSLEKRAEYQERWVAIFNTMYQQQLEHYRALVGSEGAIYIPNRPVNDVGVQSGTPAYFAGISTRMDKQRTGDQARANNVDRSFQAWHKHIQDNYIFQRNLNLSIYIVSEHALEVDLGLGPQKALTNPQIEGLAARGVDMSGYVKVNTRLTASPNHLFRVMAEKDVNRRDRTSLQDALDRGVKELDDEIDKSIEGIEDPAMRAEAIRQRAIVLSQQGQGQKYYLIKKPVIQRLFYEEKSYNSKFYAVVAKVNSLVTSAVLGTSFAWLFAQPIAEWLVWAADNPKAAMQFMQLRARRAQAIADDPESARRLGYFAATTLGTDSITSRSSRVMQGETSAAIKLARQTDLGYLIDEIVKIRALGNLDKMKGAAIREFAVLAEIDRNLSTLGRSAKAVKGQFDEIEKVADRLKNMTDAQRLKFLDSPEGRAAGRQIVQHIDDSLGNWSALKPWERPLASVIFFYPFVRFSMNWVLRTYPKNHPVRWTLATVLGQMNAEIIEDYVKADPTYSSGWAAVPIWSDESPAPVAMLQLNRIAVGGNSFFEFLGGGNPNTLGLVANTLNPGVAIPALALMGRDRYGNPLEDKDNPFGSDPLTLGDSVREMASSYARLSPISREFLRYHSFHLEGPLDSPNAQLKAAWKGDEVRKGQPGDDPNKLRDAFRRLAFPFAIPEDIDQVAARYQVNDLWERYGEAIGYSSRTYSEAAARGRERAEREQKWLSENDERSWSAGWHRRNLALSEYKRTSPDYAQYLREWGTKQEAEDEADKIALALARIYRQTGAPMPESEGFLERINKPKRERLDVKERWESLNVGMMYPGYKQAQKELKLYDSGGVIKGRKVNIKSVYSSDDRVGVSVVKQLKTSSRKAMGGRGNVSNPLDDPRTKTVEKGKQTLVTNYRGKEVVGDLTLKEVRAAERNGTIGIDDDGKITTPKTRQLVARVEGVGEQAANLLDQAAKWEGQSGGRINLPGDEGLFINELARQTGMDARVLAAWTKSEGGNSFGDYNLLNIGHAGSGPNSAASNADFSTPKSAAAATAAFLRGEWGGPGAGIPQIIDNAKGKSPAEQIRVIEQSGWRLGSIGPDPGYAKLITDVYNEQPPTLPANPKAKQALKALEPQIKAARKAYSKVAEEARAMGIEVDPLQEPGPVGTVSWGPKKARQIDGAWGGTMRILSRANRGDFAISSEKRTPEQNAAVGGSSMSDHLTTNTNSYAHDIPAVGDDQGIPIAEAYHKRLKLNEPLAIGTYSNYTSRKYPGYTFQILWNVSGHYDHVHVGARYTGEDLPAGTYSGGTVGTSVGGGGALPVGGGGGGPMPELKFADLAKGFGGIESGNLPSVAEEVAAASGNTGGDGVKSVAEQLAELPKTRKKQTLPKFDPTTRI